jgi:alpha-tubulin suppressor-like RCC1 family protein
MNRFAMVIATCTAAAVACAAVPTPTTSRASPARVTCVWGGAREAIALRSDGTVWAWGHNGMGQLGNGDNVYQSRPVQVLGPEGKGHLGSVIAIAGGEAHNVAVTADGKVWQWGQLSGGRRSNYPVPVEGLDSVAAVASRAYHTLAVQKDGSVWAWGMNVNRCLGVTSTQPFVALPERVAGVSDPIMVSAGYCYSLALLKDHTVVAWGRSKPTRSGARMVVDSPAPVAVKGLTDIVWISGGWEHALAVKSDGTVWTWGGNHWGSANSGYGRLGNGTKADQPTPAKVPGLTDVIQASGGDNFSAVLKKDGTVWTFGGNGVGQLGNGDPKLADQLSPVQVVGLKEVVYVTARDFHAQAIQADGTVWSWGSGVQGELGAGGKPLSVQEQFTLTGAAGGSPKPPYCTNSNVPVRVEWP